MKHIRVGLVAAVLILGFLTVFVLLAIVLIEQLGLEVIIGGGIVFVLVTLGAAAIDWLTEPKET